MRPTRCRTAPSRCAKPHPIFIVGKNPTFALGTAVPFGLNARMQNAWWYFGGGQELMNDFYKRFNYTALVAANSGCQMGGWFRKEIRDVADLHGLKFRIAGIAGNVLVRLGVVPQQIPGGDIYAALEKGTIDAAEWVGPYDDEKLGFNRVAPYYYYPGWWEGQAMAHYFINLDKWNALPPAYQAVMRSAASLSNEWALAKYDATNPPALRRLLASGAQLRAFSPAIMDACQKAALELYAEISARQRRLQDDLGIDAGVPQRSVPVVAGRGIFLRLLHDPQPYALLIMRCSRHRRRERAGSAGPKPPHCAKPRRPPL